MKSKIALIILIIIIVFLSILSSFLGYNYFNNKKQIEDLNKNIESLEKTSEQMGDNTSHLNSTEIIEKSVIAKYDADKVSNKHPNREYDIGHYALSNEGKLIIEKNYATYNDNIRYTLDATISDGILSNMVIGGAITCRLYLVTENGNLYVANPLSDGQEREKITKVDTLSNICRLYALGGGKNQTIIAVDINGTCYDLANL